VHPLHNLASRLPFAAYPPHPFAPGPVAPVVNSAQLAARRASIGERGQLIVGDRPDHLARFQCPRCGAATRQPCEALRPGPLLIGYHRERGYRQHELLDLGYIKYTLVNESTQRPLFLWRRPTQRPVIRDGYGPMA
jgi:hypothetical protein